MPASKNDTSASIPLALQMLFHKLQHDDNSVSTEEFTKSLGLSKQELATQQDAHEINRIIFHKLEEQMKV